MMHAFATLVTLPMPPQAEAVRRHSWADHQPRDKDAAQLYAYEQNVGHPPPEPRSPLMHAQWTYTGHGPDDKVTLHAGLVSGELLDKPIRLKPRKSAAHPKRKENSMPSGPMTSHAPEAPPVRALKPENASKAPTGRQIAVLETIARKHGLELVVEVHLGGEPLTREQASTLIGEAFENGTLERKAA